jgi:hypothetical protein
MIHRPQDLDIASSLALLQEEATQDQVVKRTDSTSYNKKGVSEAIKPLFGSFTSPTRVTEEKKNGDLTKSKFGDEKVSALKSLEELRGCASSVERSGVHSTNAQQQCLFMPWSNCGSVLLRVRNLIYLIILKI